MNARPYLSLIAFASALLGGTVAAGAQSAPYPMPTAPAADGSQAQPSATHARHPNRMRAALRQLNLSPDQRSQIAAMMKSFRASRRSATPMTRKQLLANIASVLTPDQRAKMQTLMHHRRRQPDPAPSASAS